MELGGLNKKVAEPMLGEYESPDTSNAFFKDGKYGQLGARQGKTSFNSTAYDARVKGILKVRYGNQLKWLISDTNGGVVPYTAPLATDTTPAWAYNLRRKALASTVSVTVTNPSITGSSFSLFANGDTIGPLHPYETIFCDFTSISLTVSGGSAIDISEMDIWLGVRKSGVNYWPSTAITITTGEDVLTRGLSLTASSGTGYFMSKVYQDNSLTGTIDGIAIGVDFLAGGAAPTGWTCTVSGVTLGGIA